MKSLLTRFKKQCMVAFLAAGMILGASAGAHAIDFKAKGEWLVGFGLGDSNLNGKENYDHNDMFSASQRIRLQLDAVASESLSGTVFFEIGTQDWGNAEDGGALGADGFMVKVKNAYIDWLVPETDLKFRMGLQAIALPNAAGGSAILDADVAGIEASYKFNDNVGLTFWWLRPVNDNFTDDNALEGKNKAHYLDNMDLFGLAVPVTLDGFEITPWVMYGILGRYALHGDSLYTADGALGNTLLATPGNQLAGDNGNQSFTNRFKNTNGYSDMFFAGLPIDITAWDPLHIEFDANYGYVQGFGKAPRATQTQPGGILDYKNGGRKMADTRREGWLIKALVEYKMDWGVPGIFGWYSSGDDGDVKNGSERLPSIAGAGTFTTFMGVGGTDWWANGTRGGFWEKNMTYAGTWGVGLQIRDMTFLEDLSHTFRVAYWGGTNSPDMVKFFNDANAGFTETLYDGPYMTTNDGLLEFNLDNTYQIYENLSVNLDLGYIVNMYDEGTWNRRWTKADGHMNKRDAWKAQVTFAYTF